MPAQLPPPSRPQSFRETTCCSMALSKQRSATSRLSFAFSSSSWRSLFISDGISSAYFFRPVVERRLAEPRLPANLTKCWFRSLPASTPRQSVHPETSIAHRFLRLQTTNLNWNIPARNGPEDGQQVNILIIPKASLRQGRATASLGEGWQQQLCPTALGPWR